MKNEKMSGLSARDPAAVRLADNECLYQRLKATVKLMLDDFGMPDADTPKEILTQIKQLTALAVQVSDAEDAMHEKLGTTDEGAVDYDAIRADIGGRLDRIRASLIASGLSDRPDG